MLKWLLPIAALAVLVGGFIVLPRTLLKVSGNDKPSKDDVPVSRSLLPAVASPIAGSGTPVSRRFESFATIESSAGFRPLTPSSLPAKYQPYEQFLRVQNPAEVVISYVKADGLYITIDERYHNANDTSFFRPDFLPGDRTGTRNGPPARQPRVDVGGQMGVYVQGYFGPGARTLGSEAGSRILRDTQPHRVLVIKGDLEIIVEADMTDVSRDELVRIAAGLR